MVANKNSLEFAKEMDKNDPLKSYREQFHIPQMNGKDVVYFTGNSLGLQPKTTKDFVNQELEDLAKHGVEGHFDAKNHWYSYHELLSEKSAKIVGALPSEVVVTHSLTTNLHLLMVSFYRPTKQRYKILCEKKAFPSDQYALESQVKFHGYDPESAIIEVAPKAGNSIIDDKDIIAAINTHGHQVALIMIGGVNYYSGQLFDMSAITKAGHSAGCVVGFDLAHAAGNVKLSLHDWGVDFAAWCSYKYLNSGPGGVSGLFVHHKHGNNTELPRFAGWWGHDKDTRFLMESGFRPMAGAEGWQLSNAPVLGMAAHLASLNIFDEVGLEALIEKRLKLTAYTEELISDLSNRKSEQCKLEIITPKEVHRRGAQLSILVHGKGKEVFDAITKKGVIADWREPNVIRIAPTPLYNSFEDIYRFANLLEEAIGTN